MTPNLWPIIRTQTWFHRSRRYLAPLPVSFSRPLRMGMVAAAALIIANTLRVQ
jgi:hypothetical protein